MADNSSRSLRDLRGRDWSRVLGRSAAAAIAYLVASRAFGTSSADALWGAGGVLLVLFTLQTWDVLRHGPTALGDDASEEERRPEDYWRPSPFGND